ncbi:hypothetical protein GPJ56_009678 [Histomonas meleagridis]|uniref:uncharacterized protein n=1 Tax=Histomonas meleagridis TaxID=135588 RepID=UPI003559B4FC|nr:hypothetical protein GPJ56_009678 [Histomonas meleagridis]KAH0805488.1 hypothetical protein GO595_001718 [Histomonas meleagridis]
MSLLAQSQFKEEGEGDYHFKKKKPDAIVAEDGSLLDCDYEYSSSKIPDLPPVPQLSDFPTYEKFQKAFKDFYKFLRSSNNFIFPISVSCFYRRPLNPPLLIKHRSARQRIKINEKYLYHLHNLCLSKQKIEKDEVFEKYRDRYNVSLSLLLNFKVSTWDSQLVIFPPIPEMFDEYKDFEDAYKNWVAVSGSTIQVPVHPDRIEEILQKKTIEFNGLDKSTKFKPKGRRACHRHSSVIPRKRTSLDDFTLKEDIEKRKSVINKRPRGISDGFKSILPPNIDLKEKLSNLQKSINNEPTSQIPYSPVISQSTIVETLSTYGCSHPIKFQAKAIVDITAASVSNVFDSEGFDRLNHFLLLILMKM